METPIALVFRVAKRDLGQLHPQTCHLWPWAAYFSVCHDVNNVRKHCFRVSNLSHSPQICTTKCWSLVLTSWMAYGSARSLWWFTFLHRPSSGVAPGLWLTPPSTRGTWRCMLTEKAGSAPSSFPLAASGGSSSCWFPPGEHYNQGTFIWICVSPRGLQGQKNRLSRKHPPAWGGNQAGVRLSQCDPHPRFFYHEVLYPGTPKLWETLSCMLFRYSYSSSLS